MRVPKRTFEPSTTAFQEGGTEVQFLHIAEVEAYIFAVDGPEGLIEHDHMTAFSDKRFRVAASAVNENCART